MKLILIRHPETVANAQRLIYGHADWGYSERGDASSQKAADYVKKNYKKYLESSETRILATPLSRTKILADKIADGTDIKVEIEESLIELNVGILENLSLEQVEAQFTEEWKNFSSKNVDYRIPQGESWRDVYHRVEPFMESLKEQKGTIIAVTHAMVIRSILAHILSMDLNSTWHFKIEPSSLIEIDFYKSHGVINKIIDFHLDEKE